MMEITIANQENVVKSTTTVEATVEGSIMNEKPEFHIQPQDIKFDNASDAICTNEVGKQDTVAVVNDNIETNSVSEDKTDVTKDINLQTEFPPDATKVSFPMKNINLCQIMSCDQREQNINQPLSNNVITDKTNVITRSTINFEDKTTSQWDEKILDSVTNNELVCSEIENYLKNNLNLPNASRRETTKVDFADNNLTNELFKNVSEINDTNDNKQKAEVLSSIETTIFDKLISGQNKLDLHAGVSFNQCESGAEMISNIHSSNLFGKNIPICFAGVTTCESIEKNERMKAKDEIITNNHSISEKLSEYQNTPIEVTAKPTSTIDFLSGSFRSEETIDVAKDKNKNRNLRNVVVAKLSEAHAENSKEFEPNKNASTSVLESDIKIKESDIAVNTDALQPRKEFETAIKAQNDPLNKKRGQVWSSDSEGDSDSSSDRSSYNSSTFDNSDDSCSTLSTISKKRGDINVGPKKWRQPKTKGELGLEDLPPIQDLVISVEERELEETGTVSSIVEELVIIQGSKDKPALDLDSVLFLDDGKPLGQVFDVFGPVVQPSYAIRFNNNKEIVEKGIAKGCTVYSAPSHADITKYVFPEKLRREKGSDASWENNNEPPEQHIDYSDDEKEKEAKKRGKPRNMIMKRSAFSQPAQLPSNQVKNEKLHTMNGTPLRPPVFQVPRLPPPSHHPGFPYGPPPPLPPFASRYPAAPIFGAMPELPVRPSFTTTSNTRNIPFCMSTPPPPLPGNNSNSSIPFCIPPPLPPLTPPPPPPGNNSNSSIPFCIPSTLPPPTPPPRPPGNPLNNSLYCPPLQHNMFGPYGTTLPSFSGSTDITTRPLLPPSRIGAPSVAPFPPPPFATGLPIPPRPQFS